MTFVAHYIHLLEGRAAWLALIVLLGFVVGAIPARLTRLNDLFAEGNRIVARLGRKLDKANRGIATLVYRGIIACAIVLLPTIAVAALLLRPVPWVELLAALLMVAWFGRALATDEGLKLWQRARGDTTPLELPHVHYLFADGHAVLRYSIAARAEAFAVGVVGAGFWYVLAGLPAMLCYLAMASAAFHFQGVAFGWAARSLFRLVDFAPRVLAGLLLLLAALFTPHTKPVAALRARSWLAFVAGLLDVALGGPGPRGNLPWAGSGTARLTHPHLRRALVLQAVATVWLVLLLASPTIYKSLIKFI